ncbi:MAG: hypothetical protein HWD92_08875 [Flavobacteriia bacterium]|nr:hypothetical protein [Flavobacteriia bacterium]
MISENRYNLPSIQSSLAIGYVILILLSYYRLDHFYRHFDIQISNYLTPTEYLMPVLPVASRFIWVLPVIVIFILIMAYGHPGDVKSDEETSDDVENSQLKYRFNGIALILAPLVLISVSFVHHYLHLEYLWIGHIVTGVFLVLVLFYLDIRMYGRIKRKGPVRHGMTVLFLVVVISSVLATDSTRRAKKILIDKELVSECQYFSETLQMSTSESLFFIDESMEYIFFYDFEKSESVIIKKTSGYRIHYKKALSKSTTELLLESLSF